MKKVFIAIILVTACLISCKSTGSNVSDFEGATGKEWKLVEVYVETSPFNRRVIYDRNDLKKEKIESTYTFSLTADTISGVGAPNRYSAPYTRKDNTIEVKMIRSTQMAPLVQPEKLQEHVYFSYIQNAYEWRIDNGKLVLITKTEDDSPVRMVFAL